MMSLHDLAIPRPLLIAEIGGNHNGDLSYAYELAGLAVDYGADVVKFQTYSADTLVNKRIAPDRYAHFRRLQLDVCEWSRLAAFVQDRGAHWMTSLWDIELIDQIAPLVPAWKVGSGDLTNFPLLDRLLGTGKPIILSCAMATVEDVRRAIDRLAKRDPTIIPERRLGLLQCTALYDEPTALEANLLVIRNLAETFPEVIIGYSNHHVHPDACVIALALGARIIEVHFTTDRSQAFRDHRLSILPDELRRLRALCEEVPALLGSPDKYVAAAEAPLAKQFRRGVYPCRSIDAGTVLDSQDLVTLRPEVGIPAWQFDEVIGRRTRRALEPLVPLSFQDFI